MLPLLRPPKGEIDCRPSLRAGALCYVPHERARGGVGPSAKPACDAFIIRLPAPQGGTAGAGRAVGAGAGRYLPDLRLPPSPVQADPGAWLEIILFQNLIVLPGT